MSEGPVPSVSVVMPAYNAEKYLREAVDSTLAQTYSDFEFIIINDGSTDSTKEIIQNYNDSRIIYVENEQNLGICVTLNKGLDIARGRYIVRMDSDDIMLPNRISVQVDFMDKNPQVGVAGCLVERFSDDCKVHDFPSSEIDYYQCKADLLLSTCVAHPATIIRRSVLERYNLRYDDNFRGMEDFHLWWRVSRYAFITNVPEILLKYRIHNDQITQIPVTNDFLNRKKSFIKQRLSSVGVDFTDNDIDSILKYETSNASFNDDTMEDLLQCFRKVLRKIKGEREYYIAQKLVAGKAISYTYDLSRNNITRSNLYYMWRAYSLSCMTLTWFIKRVYRNFIPKV